MREVREPEVIRGYRLGRRLDVAGSAETYEATGPDGQVVVLRVPRDVSPELAADMSARLGAAAKPGCCRKGIRAYGQHGDQAAVR